MDTETVGRGTALVSPVIERITRPTLTGQGRKAPALRFGDLRVQPWPDPQVHAGESVHRRRAGAVALMDVGSFDSVASETIRTFVT
jgi:hypothetical protein